MADERYHTLVLSADAGIRSAQNVLASLRETISHHDRIGIDTQTVTAADLTTVQSLLSARNKAAELGKSVVMLAPLGAALADVLQAAGFLAEGQAQASFWSPVSEPLPRA